MFLSVKIAKCSLPLVLFYEIRVMACQYVK